MLVERGADVIRLPTIAIEFPDELLDAATDPVWRLRSGTYDWVVFSSRPGVTALLSALERAGVGPEVFDGVKVATVGSATSRAFADIAGRGPDVVPANFTARDVAAALGEGPGRVLLPRPEAAPRSILDDLAARGWDPQELPLYRTVQGAPPPHAVERVRRRDFDVLTFTSGSTVRFFVEIVGPIPFDDHHRVVVIGPATESVARATGLRVDAVADPHTTEGVVDAVERVVGR